MPQVWLNDEELGEFLECEPVAARHHAVANEWPCRTGFDGVVRYVLPPAPALKYVLWNARSQPAPGDAVALKQALGQVSELQGRLAEAQATIEELRSAVQALEADRTTDMVVALRAAAAEMRARLGEAKAGDADRSVA